MKFSNKQTFRKSNNSFQHNVGIVKTKSRLEVDLLNRAHGGLDVDDLDVLPLLLQERDEEVDGENNVTLQLVSVEVDMTDRDGEAEDLLHLELDGVENVVDLLSRVFVVVDDRRELTSSVKTGTHDSRKLLDEGIRSQESVVLLSELTDELLVLVEVGDFINVHARNTFLLTDLLVLIVDEDADINVRSGGVGEDEGTSETLILSGINLLESDLEFNSLDETSLLTLHLGSIDFDFLTSRIGEDGVDSLVHNFAANFTTQW